MRLSAHASSSLPLSASAAMRACLALTAISTSSSSTMRSAAIRPRRRPASSRPRPWRLLGQEDVHLRLKLPVPSPGVPAISVAASSAQASISPAARDSPPGTASCATMTTHHLRIGNFRGHLRGVRGLAEVVAGPDVRAPAALQRRTRVKRNFVACLNYPLPRERKRTNRASKTCAILTQVFRSFARITRLRRSGANRYKFAACRLALY